MPVREPWFVGSDVAKVLGYVNPDEAVRKHWKAARDFRRELRGNLVVQGRPPRLIPERDVYRLVMRSKLPSAEAFEEWVVAKVLPAIRKNGRYEAPRQEEPKRNALATALEGIGGALIELKEDIDAARDEFRDGLAEARSEIERLRSSHLRGAAADPELAKRAPAP